jgi:hypothetical protein
MREFRIGDELMVQVKIIKECKDEKGVYFVVVPASTDWVVGMQIRVVDISENITLHNEEMEARYAKNQE